MQSVQVEQNEAPQSVQAEQDEAPQSQPLQPVQPLPEQCQTQQLADEDDENDLDQYSRIDAQNSQLWRALIEEEERQAQQLETVDQPSGSAEGQQVPPRKRRRVLRKSPAVCSGPARVRARAAIAAKSVIAARGAIGG